MSMNDMPGVGPTGGTDRPAPPQQGQGQASRPVPGGQQNQNSPAHAQEQLAELLGHELIANGRSILAKDARAFAISTAKLRQIKAAAMSLGQQPGQQYPGDQAPQGPRTGVDTPRPQPVDVHTRQPI
jgi:hypothetical protein